MNLQRIYDQLIQRSRDRLTHTQAGEFHHIVPVSMGGALHGGNIAYLTVREHYLAHLLLYRMGNSNQIFSVAAMLTDRLNPQRKELRWKRWVRKWHNRETQRCIRERNRELLGLA